MSRIGIAKLNKFHRDALDARGTLEANDYSSFGVVFASSPAEDRGRFETASKLESWAKRCE